MAHDTLERHLAHAKDLSAFKNKSVELGFFSKGKNSFIEKMVEGASESFRLTDNGMSYEFREPVFVNTLTVDSANEQEIQIKYEVQTSSTAWEEIAETNVSETDGHSVCKINAFIKAFKIAATGDTMFFSPTEKVKKIKISYQSCETTPSCKLDFLEHFDEVNW